ATRVTRISLESVAEDELPVSSRGSVPKAKGVKRVTALRGYFELTPQEDGTTNVVFQLHLDPAGGLPSGLVNSLIVDNPFETLKQLRVVVQQAQYQNFNPF
ncbi:MAG: START domain-containing protein, partial [Spongiibacter marinus]|uniref:START domain-containing protein n=1 Tax=Spongiibacter marinus TaxID=354246 RepID=UPI003C66114F